MSSGLVPPCWGLGTVGRSDAGIDELQQAPSSQRSPHLHCGEFPAAPLRFCLLSPIHKAPYENILDHLLRVVNSGAYRSHTISIKIKMAQM